MKARADSIESVEFTRHQDKIHEIFAVRTSLELQQHFIVWAERTKQWRVRQTKWCVRNPRSRVPPMYSIHRAHNFAPFPSWRKPYAVEYIYIYSFYAADQGNEVYGGGEESVGIFLHRSSDDGIVKGEGMELKANLGRSM